MALLAAVAQFMQDGMSRMDAFIKAGPYQSRGHGKGWIGKKYGKSRSKYVPHEGKRQINRAKRQGLHMETVNGFPLIQRLKGTGIIHANY